MAVDRIDLEQQNTQERAAYISRERLPILSLVQTVEIEEDDDGETAKLQSAAALILKGSLITEQVPAETLPNPYRVDQKPVELIGELHQQILAHQKMVEAEGGTVNDVSMVRIEKGSKFGNIARYIESRVFKEEWYKNYSNEKFAQEAASDYEAYDADSRFIVLVDNTNTDEDGLPALIGMCRVAGQEEKLIKTLNDVPKIWDFSKEEIMEDIRKYEDLGEKPEDLGAPEATWDIISLAVEKPYRLTQAYNILSHELYDWARSEGVNTFVTIFVKQFFTLYRFRGVPFRAIADAEPKVHMNALSVPSVLHLIAPERMLENNENIRAHDACIELLEGKGLKYDSFVAE